MENNHRISSSARSLLREYIISSGVVLGVSVVSYQFAGHVGYQAVSLFLLFAVALLSLSLSVGPVVLAAALSALIWNYFFIPPHFTFAIGSPQDALLFIAYFVIAAITGILTTRIRMREKNARSLYSMTKDIIHAKTLDDVARLAVKNIRTVFECDVLLFLSSIDGELNPEPHEASTLRSDKKEFSVASWVYWNEKKAGRNVDTFPFVNCTYYPISGPRYPLGVIGIRLRGLRPIDPAREALFQNFIEQIASALEREQLHELTRRAVVSEESEKLYRTLFSSLSHELRTPIAAIMGGADSLSKRIPSEELEEIHTAADRLNRLVENLLDMTRLESGQLAPRLDWCDVNDLLRTSAQKIKKELAAHIVVIDVPESTPFIRLDFGLMEQVFSNLLYNASLYTPPGSTITITAKMEKRNCIFTVEDNGPGFPMDALQHLFNKFYRVPGSRTGGTGLGLSIVKGYVEAHKGTISAANRILGGAEFVISIPTETHSTTLS